MSESQALPPAQDEVWTFERFSPGLAFGETTIRLDRARLERWQAIYGKAGEDSVPRGLLVTAMMEAYLDLIQPRPPGNIHASQKLTFGPRAARLNEPLALHVTCGDKTTRKGRGWVTFEVTVKAGEDMLLRGEIRTIWAR
ncbi:hypothetical protein [Pseudohoeflea coraliihabitans]|uniref:MaoC-like domain-containing protein n=1 Tax=Pseudohoeflea coraliihabitans TaxID=2860393 RepID=A0ABS6WQD3_9HYPH|nr:hypothetical protein [Pseudohoeflea sp. DP4N28-3]MBW3098176.1 hypothetical protein [Pseudohoeflea sp. DP4N28-3]